MTGADVRRWRIVMWMFLALAVVSLLCGEYLFALGCLTLSAVYGVGSGILEAVLVADRRERRNEFG